MVIKKPAVKPPLSMVEIVMRADVATIEAALEARRKIDALLAERAAAYERIAALEKQIDEVIGAPDEFVFPPPPMPVAPFAAVSAPVASRPAPSATHTETPAPAEESAPTTTPHAAPASHATPAGESASAAKKSAASRNSNQN